MKRILHYMVLLIFLGGKLSATELNVTPETIIASLSTAADGDVLLLAPGTYSTAFGIQNNKALTIKSDGTGTVTLTFQLSASASNTGGGLIFDGVTIKRDDSYFINGALGKVDILAFRNCTIQNVNRCLVRTTDGSAATMTNFEISNSIIEDCGSGGWALTRFNHDLVNVNIKGNTFDTYQAEDIFLSTAAAKNTAFNTNFVFENNTVYKSIKDGDYAVCKPNNKFSDASSYTFRNNIFNLNYTTSTKVYLLTGVTTGGSLIAQKNLIVNFGNTTKSYNYTTIPTVTNTDITLSDLELTSIGFADPGNGDFSILSTSPIATASTSGGILGDPRWLKVVTVPANLTTSLSALGAGTVSPSSGTFNVGEDVTLTATNNFGYHFKEWQNADNGNVLSTSNPYTFAIAADINIKAVYEAVTTYNFTVNKTGSNWGTVKLSPEPINGKYETGTEVTMTVVPNAVSTFSYWEDNSTAQQRTVTVNSDLTYTATFDEIPFIVGWDFKERDPREGRPGDYYSASDKRGTISVFSGVTNTTIAWSDNAGMSSPSYPGLRLWTPFAEFNAGTRRYLQAQFSTEGFKNIQVKSMVSGNYQGYSVYKLQYSIDGTTYTDISGATVDISNGSGGYKSTWSDLNVTLPQAAEGKPAVYLRWVADETSAKIDPNTGNPGSDVEGTAYTNIFIYADKEIVNDTDAPLLISKVPEANSTTATINGSIVLTFNERVKVGTGDITLGSKVLTGVYGSKSVTFAYEKLSYNTAYTVTVPAGALTDMSGNSYAGITFTYTTANRTEPTKKLFDAVVAKDGSGDYISVIDAIAAAPENRTTPWMIFIKNGTYSGHHEIPATKPYIHLIGQSRDGVIITDNVATNTNPSWEQGATMYVNGANCYFENITFQNEFGYIGKVGPPALAFYTKGDRFAMKNTYLRSFQDTYYTGGTPTNRSYILNSRIEGAVDYIYGDGNLFFDNDTLTNARKGSVIVAPDHSSETAYGYVFRDCIINEDPTLTEKGDHKFGRPWKGTPKAVFINTKLLAGLNPQGWADMGALPDVFADYGTVDQNGNPVDVSQRKSQYYSGGTLLGTAKNSLTAIEAAAYTYENVILRSGDTWDPRLMAEAPNQPLNLQLSGTNLTWDAVAYTRLYIVFRNGTVLDFTTNNQFTDATAVPNTSYKYTVQAVGEFGALSKLATPVEVLPLKFLSFKASVTKELAPTVNLTWSTTNEVNTSKFEVERSIDGKVFTKIGTVNSLNTAGIHNYSFIDQNPLDGDSYYRLNQIDLDGKSDYSDLRSVNIASGISLVLYPNPVSSELNINHPKATTNANLALVTTTGKKVLSLPIAVSSTNTKIDLGGLAAGTYILVFENGSEKQVSKFVKK